MTMETPELLKGLLIALTASALTLGAHTVLINPVESERVEAIPVQDVGGNRIERVLERLEAFLESHESQLANADSLAVIPTNRRVSVGAGDVPYEAQQILERLTAIEHQLSVRPRIVREMRPLDRHRAPDILAIRAAIDLREVDREAFESDLHMRTMHEIVERFGYPSETETSGNQCEVYWKYELPSTDPENPNYFALYFAGGLVSRAKSRWTD